VDLALLTALGASFLFVFALLGAGMALLHLGVVDSFTSRKLIHIGVGHWWFFHLFWIQDPVWGLVGPVFFIAFNLLARQWGFLKAMEPGRGESNLGTIYFPLTLAVMVAWSGWGGMPLWVTGAGVLVLSWGDGLAALVGRAWGRHPLPTTWSHKTWEGTVALVVASTLVLLAFFIGFLAPEDGVTAAWLWSQSCRALAIALVLAVVEGICPWGLDNLVVPVAATGLVWLIL